MRLATFRGAVSCRRDPGAPLAVTLSGASAEPPDEPLTLGFAAVEVPELPAVLTDPLIEHDGGVAYRIVTAGETWRIDARAVHLHREVGRTFYQAIPPRPVPRARRALWRTVLALAASRVGVAALRALRH
ncbi:MAG TPA: hypothetical protein VEU54_10945 [Steroidobacteraceae bacterium]|jgi:hypothetical protein|nr:hypothetical protein [Steroidobacteraceae bacterium]